MCVRLFLERAQLEYSEEESHILGQGGSGTIIYRARYRSSPVAIKRFHFKRCQKQTVSSEAGKDTCRSAFRPLLTRPRSTPFAAEALVSVPDTMVRHLRSADAYRSFTEFRQEASMLRSLQHPCIVYLVGINIHPLCFALQLAPLGSLNTVLEEQRKGKGGSRGAPSQLHKLLASVKAQLLCHGCRLRLHAPRPHDDLQSGLSDRSRTGVSSQEEHHLLRPQIRQYPGVVAGGAYRTDGARMTFDMCDHVTHGCFVGAGCGEH